MSFSPSAAQPFTAVSTKNLYKQDGEVPEVVVVKDVGAKNSVVSWIVAVAVEVTGVVIILVVVSAAIPVLQMHPSAFLPQSIHECEPVSSTLKLTEYPE